jgi:hypothetical protein
MVFHISFDQGVGQTFIRVAAAGSVFDPSLGSFPWYLVLFSGRAFSFISRLTDEGFLSRDSAIKHMD